MGFMQAFSLDFFCFWACCRFCHQLKGNSLFEGMLGKISPNHFGLKQAIAVSTKS
jgi:hypothetical protein